MRKRLSLVLLLFPLIVAGGNNILQLRRIPSPNLLVNADFSKLDAQKCPQSWRFDNCSRSPYFRSQVVTTADGNYLAIDAPWVKFGYWMQSIQLKEGESYFVSCEVQSDAPVPAIWFKCDVTKKTTQRSPGQAEYIFSRALRFDDEMREVLKDFFDENMIKNLSPVNWNRIYGEVVIPKYQGISSAVVRIGIYGGEAGQARYRKPVFRSSRSTLEAKITGTGWHTITVKGAQPSVIKLDPGKAEQSVSMILPKALTIYRVELSGNNGQKIIKEVSND